MLHELVDLIELFNFANNVLIQTHEGHKVYKHSKNI